jgi:hypothetical protein
VDAGILQFLNRATDSSRSRRELARINKLKRGKIMLQIGKMNEIAVHIRDIHRAEDLLATIKTQGIEVLAHCCVPARAGAMSLVVVDEPQRAKAVLEHAGLECKTNPVVLVRTPPHPAVAARLGSQLTAEQIGIRYCYVTPHNDTQVHVVFKTTDDDHAIRVLLASASRPNQGVECRQQVQRPPVAGLVL